MKRVLLYFTLFTAAALAADKVPAQQLFDMARVAIKSPGFREALIATASEAAIQKGAAFIGQGPEFLFAVESAGVTPKLFIDELPGPVMTQVPGSNLWIARTQLRTGFSHSFYYTIDGKRFGGSYDVPAYGPDSYEQPGVPKGALSEKMIHKSKIYDGMESEYWVYVPAQYDASKPACLMVWQDGGGHVNRGSVARVQNVIDNLTFQGKIPVMISIFTNPGDISNAVGTPTYEFVSNFSKSTGRTLKDSMRSTEYDTVSDRYVRFLRDELIEEVAKKYNLRKDAYSHAIWGSSSGGIAAFNAAWQMPSVFSRVLSQIGTFTSIQWQPGKMEGGEILPFRVRKDEKRNIRVWLNDGSEDNESAHGSWPLQNIQMANSLKMRGYDFHFSFSPGTHNGAHGGARMPEALTWLWRDYDPSKTSQNYEQEESEKAKPLFRVKIYNRDAE